MPCNAGRCRSCGIEPLEMRRMMAFADADASWGTNGVGPDVSVLSEQPDGRILATESDESGLHLVRLNADGSYDTTFSHDGRVPIDVSVTAARGLTGGNIVVAYSYRRRVPGQSDSVYTPDDDYVNGYGVARYTARGALDTTFGDGGYRSAAFRSSKIGQYARLAGVAIDADGSTYFGVSGDYLNILSRLETFSSFVLKFNAGGIRETTYGRNGVAVLPSLLRIGRTGNYGRVIDSLTLTDSGPLLVAGTEFRFDNKRLPYADNDSVHTGTSSFVSRLTPHSSTSSPTST